MNRCTRLPLVLGMLLAGSAATARGEALSEPPLPDAAPAPPAEHFLNRVTLGPASLIVGALTLEYERAVGPTLSVFVGPRLEYSGDLVIPGVRPNGIGGSVGLRYYRDGEAPSGFWFGPELYGMAKRPLDSDPNDRSDTVLGLLMLGYTFVGQGGFTFSIGGGAGGGYIWAKEADTLVRLHGAVPGFGFQSNLGWAF